MSPRQPLYCILIAALGLAACVDDGFRVAPPDAGFAPELPTPDAGPLDFTIIAMDAANPVALAVGTTHLYWLNEGFKDDQGPRYGASLMRVPLGGGTPELVTEISERPVLLRVSGTTVYWITSEFSDSGSLWQLQDDGSSLPRMLFDEESSVGHLAVGPDRLYWKSAASGTINSSAKDGSNVRALCYAEPLNDILLFESTIYWADDEQIMQAPTDGSAAFGRSLYHHVDSNFSNLNIFEDSLLWTTELNGVAVTRMRRDTRILSYVGQVPDAESAGGVAAAGNELFFSTLMPDGRGLVHRTSIATGQTDLLFSLPTPITGPILGPDHVYWLSKGDPQTPSGMIYMLAR